MNSHNWTTVIGVLASVLTIIQVVLYLTALPEETPQPQLLQIIFYQSAVILCIIGLCILLTNAQIKNSKLQEQNKLIDKGKINAENTFSHKNSIISLLAKTHHNTNHEIRQMLYSFCLLDMNIPEDNDSEPTIPDEKSQTDELSSSEIEDDSTDEILNEIITQKFHHNTGKLQKFMTYFMANVKNVFDTITMDDCSVHISLIDDNDDSFVTTSFRDPSSETERTNVDLKYPKYRIESFTPYKYLMNNIMTDPIFICNDCSKYDNYCDRNDNWKDFYNACISVPIRVRVDGKNNEHNQIGFLTVDNYKGFYGYEKIACDQIKAFADGLFMVFETYLISCALTSQETN